MLLKTALVMLLLTPPPARAATLEALVGTLTIKGDSEAVATPSELPRTLRAGSRVETSIDGKARIVLDDGTELTLSASTEIEVPSGQKSSSLRLVLGRMRVLVNRAAASRGWGMKVRATAMGVRGTEFIVEASRDRAVLCSLDGAVEVKTDGFAELAQLVQANEGVIINFDGKITPPVAMDRRQMDWWRQDTLLDRSDSPQTSYRALTDVWHWWGPAAIERLDPASTYSDFQLLSAGGAVWGRVVGSDNAGRFTTQAPSEHSSLTARAVLNATLVPNAAYLLHAEGMAAVKSGMANPDGTGLRVHQAFVLVRPKSLHSVVVGRQEWEFGDGLMIGREPWNPFTRSFDGVLATARFAPVRVRAFGALLTDKRDLIDTRDYLAGIYAEGSKSPLSLYGIFTRRVRATTLSSSNDFNGHHLTVGERLELFGVGPVPLFINEEFAYQFGKIGVAPGGPLSLASYLGYADAGLSKSIGPVEAFGKFIFLQASGTKSESAKIGSFMPLFPDSHRFLGVVNAFPQIRNIRRFGPAVGGRASIHGRLATFQAAYSFFGRVSADDTVYPRVTDVTKTDLGQELDLELGYEPHPLVFVQAAYGRLSPGNAYGEGAEAAYKAFLIAQFRF